MSWICPVCNRTFRSKNQSHSCEVTDENHHFVGKPVIIHQIYAKVIDSLNEAGPINISFVKNAIIISAKSTFLAIKPKAKYVDLEFLLRDEILEFPIHKTFRVSKNKVAHFIKLETPDDVDPLVKRWLKQAYTVNAG
jgi:hypothetical protein